jgi:ATPase components of various ABC-type transport systems, contain duplicated ATPase
MLDKKAKMNIETREITKVYAINRGHKNLCYAVKGVNIHISAGEIVGLLGNSGSGKTTIGMILAGLLKPTSGSILYNGQMITYPYKGDLRKNIQILFQHPEISFNPMLPIIKSMNEPYNLYNPPFTKEKLLRDLKRVGLYEEHLNRYPSEMSGGQLQRLALIRLLVLRPSLIILDEPTSMLDVISQAQIINMLKEYQYETNCAFLLISHNRELVRAVCNKIYVIEKGIVSKSKVFE